MNPNRPDDFARDMAALYADVDRDIAARNPVCTNRGACCKFGEFGHRLYVTDVEITHFVRGHEHKWRKPSDEAVCPYQIEGMCTAREDRPLGCRIFFCDPAAQEWQGPEYERFLARLKRIGDEHGIAYQYREWLSALRQVPLPQGAMKEADQGGFEVVAVDRMPLPVIKSTQS